MFRIGDDLVALVTDTACDLPDEVLQQYDIRLVSLRIATSTGEYRDRREISQDELYRVLEKEIPKTSLPLPEDITELYAQLASEGCTRVLHMSLSGNLSGSYNLTRMLAEETEGIRVSGGAGNGS